MYGFHQKIKHKSPGEHRMNWFIMFFLGFYGHRENAINFYERGP